MRSGRAAEDIRPHLGSQAILGVGAQSHGLLLLPGIVVDEKRDRKRLGHLLTERALMASSCSSGAQTELAFI